MTNLIAIREDLRTCYQFLPDIMRGQTMNTLHTYAHDINMALDAVIAAETSDDAALIEEAAFDGLLTIRMCKGVSKELDNRLASDTSVISSRLITR